MAKKKTKAKAKGTLVVENDARGRRYDRREEEFIAAEADFDEKAQAEVDEKLAEAEKELVEIVEEEVAIYKKGMKGKHIAELFEEE